MNLVVVRLNDSESINETTNGNEDQHPAIKAIRQKDALTSLFLPLNHTKSTMMIDEKRAKKDAITYRFIYLQIYLMKSVISILGHKNVFCSILLTFD